MGVQSLGDLERKNFQIIKISKIYQRLLVALNLCKRHPVYPPANISRSSRPLPTGAPPPGGWFPVWPCSPGGGGGSPFWPLNGLMVSSVIVNSAAAVLISVFIVIYFL
jgi:hypothetical protein